jgi:hypothetical protein
MFLTPIPTSTPLIFSVGLRFRKTTIFFVVGLWTYKQQRLDFKDNFEDSDVENLSQLLVVYGRAPR